MELRPVIPVIAASLRWPIHLHSVSLCCRGGSMGSPRVPLRRRCLSQGAMRAGPDNLTNP